MIRKAEIHDCEEVYARICELEKTTFPYDIFLHIFQKQLHSEQYLCLVYEQESNIIGVLNVRYEEQLHHCEIIAEILEFVIMPEYRGKGIGSEMLKQAYQHATAFGCSQIEVTCNQQRTSAHSFYLRDGMKNSHFKFSKLLSSVLP